MTPTRWPAWWGRLTTLALGAERRQRAHTAMSLLGAAVYAVCVLLEAFGTQSGFTDARYAPALVAFMLAGPMLFYGLLRSGWTQGLREPSIALPQVLYAIVILTLGYPVNGSVRGLNLMLLALLPVFCIGILSPRGIRSLGALSLVSISTMMAWLALYRPVRFDPKLELVHFVLATAAIPAVAQVAAAVSGLRIRQRRQREELKAALAQLEQLATRDELTGLLNRNHMQVQLIQEAQRSQRQGWPLCIGLIDLDHFKRVNDQRGHTVGDRVLQRFALRCSAVLRESDVLARWGGEEFLLMLPATPLADAERVLARLRYAQLQLGEAADGPLPSVSFSAGLALHQPADDVQATIARADAALYGAKASGRDRVVVAADVRNSSTDPSQAANTL